MEINVIRRFSIELSQGEAYRLIDSLSTVLDRMREEVLSKMAEDAREQLQELRDLLNYHVSE